MIPRLLENKIVELAQKFPVITITGPRQSGKTTLAKALFPDYYYANLENPEERALAEDDPNAFLARHQKGIVIDEAQYVPKLFSYIQVLVDAHQRPGEFILSGSQNFLLLEKISQSLAGRVAIFHLLPFGMEELKGTDFQQESYTNYIWKGFYPRLYDSQIAPVDFYPNYIQTYLERDVRQVVNVSDLRSFRIFLQLCAGRVGQLFNQTALANEVGVDQKTIKRWLSILETGFVGFTLTPYFKNFSKRLIKTPKFYFYDTGLACSLLGIRTAEELSTHYLKGALFENLIIVETLKQFYHRGEVPSVYFWRDYTGNEVDMIVEKGLQQYAVEIKSAETLQPALWKGLENFQKISGLNAESNFLIYGGMENYDRSATKIRSWNQLPIWSL